jgi:hypothetical protein
MNLSIKTTKIFKKKKSPQTRSSIIHPNLDAHSAVIFVFGIPRNEYLRQLLQYS